MISTTMTDDVAVLAQAFERLRQGARLKELRLPRRLRAAVTHALAIKKPSIVGYFWK